MATATEHRDLAVVVQPSFLEIISRAASDPQVNIEKMQAILEMQRAILADQAKIEFARDMRLVQEEMLPIVRDAENRHTQSRYARLETIDRGLRPIYTRHGFSLTFNSPQNDEKDGLTISCTVLHESGHSRDYSLSGALDGAGSQGKANKTPIQALGSSVSYLRRYLTAMIFNIVLADEDNDGNRVDQQRVAERKIQEIRNSAQTCPACGGTGAQCDVCGTKPAPTPAPAKRGEKAPLDPAMLKGFQDMKAALFEQAGTHMPYYEILNRHNYEKSNQIPTRQEGVVIYKEMGSTLAKLRDIRTMRREIQAHLQRMGEQRFYEICEGHDRQSIEDLHPDALEGLLNKLNAAKDLL